MIRRCHSPPQRCPRRWSAPTQDCLLAVRSRSVSTPRKTPAASSAALDRPPPPGCSSRGMPVLRGARWLRWYAVAVFVLFGAPLARAQVEQMGSNVESRRELPAETREMARDWPTPLLADEPLAGWWDAAVRQPLWRGTTGYDTLLDDLVGRTLQYSLEMKAASQQVLIRQTMIEEASSVFDWATFLESKWRDLNEPVGNTLVTGGPPRLLQDQVVTKGGVRRRNELGGEVEFSQQLGIEHSNSLFFVPPNQGQSRMALSYRQPLLRGAGRKYNRALIALASIDTLAARDQFLTDLEQHLFDVSRAYWTLYQERALLLQKRRSVEQVAEWLRILQKRQSLDVVTSQLVRAQAAYEQRRAAIVRADAAVRDSEARLRLLVNDPALPFGPSYELVPDESPYAIPARVDFPMAVATAIHNRPDLGRVMQEIKMGAVRVEMSQQELLPALELLLETYVMGLDGSDNVWGAVGGQFGEGAPSYTAGLMFEVPIGNRAARARLERRQFELGQLQSQMQFAIERVKVEVELSVREVETCWREMGAQFTVMRASRERLDYLQQRWLRLPGEEGTAGLVMEDLLAAQDVLVEAEAAFVRAQTTYNVALVGLQRTTGTLLHDEGVVLATDCRDNLPQLVAERAQKLPSPFMAPAREPAEELLAPPVEQPGSAEPLPLPSTLGIEPPPGRQADPRHGSPRRE